MSIPVSATSSNAESGDYSVNGTPLTFASGDTSKTFTVSTTNDSDRDDETVNLAFGQLPASVGTGTQSTATLTINDTTPAPRSNTKSNSGGGGGGGGGGSSSYSNYQRSSSPVYVPPPSNNAPVFTEGDSTHRSVAENIGSSSTIGSPVSATDTDNDTLTYHLGGLDGASFSINPNSGHLLTSSVLDFEVQSSYSVYILVSDGEGGTDRIDVTIFVIDVDETPAQVAIAQVAVPTPEPTPTSPRRCHLRRRPRLPSQRRQQRRSRPRLLSRRLRPSRRRCRRRPRLPLPRRCRPQLRCRPLASFRGSTTNRRSRHPRYSTSVIQPSLASGRQP